MIIGPNAETIGPLPFIPETVVGAPLVVEQIEIDRRNFWNVVEVKLPATRLAEADQRRVRTAHSDTAARGIKQGRIQTASEYLEEDSFRLVGCMV